MRKIPIKPGDRFGRGVTVEEIRFPPSPWSAARGYSGALGWRMRCDCGNEYQIRVVSLRSGNTQSCGCLRNELSSARMSAQHADPEWQARANARNSETKTTHGLTAKGSPNERNFKRWREMVARCHDPRNHAFKDYGARGIQVCEQWRNDPVAYCAWLDENLGPCPPGHSLDRIDNDKGYEPGNLRWADGATQVGNRRPLRTHCKHGHEWTEENTYYPPGGDRRMCRACMTHRQRERRRKH